MYLCMYELYECIAYVCMHLCVCMYVYIYVYLYVCMCAYVYVIFKLDFERYRGGIILVGRGNCPWGNFRGGNCPGEMSILRNEEINLRYWEHIKLPPAECL